MSQIRLYVDEDATHNIIVDGLRRVGFNIVTASQLGMRAAPDEAHLALAVQNDRVLYTLNAADFARLHKETLRKGGQHKGIIIIPRQRYSPSEKLRRLKALLETTSAEDMLNAIRYI